MSQKRLIYLLTPWSQGNFPLIGLNTVLQPWANWGRYFQHQIAATDVTIFRNLAWERSGEKPIFTMFNVRYTSETRYIFVRFLWIAALENCNIYIFEFILYWLFKASERTRTVQQGRFYSCLLFYACLITPNGKTGLRQLPIVSSAFKPLFVWHVWRERLAHACLTLISPCWSLLSSIDLTRRPSKQYLGFNKWEYWSLTITKHVQSGKTNVCTCLKEIGCSQLLYPSLEFAKFPWRKD